MPTVSKAAVIGSSSIPSHSKPLSSQAMPTVSKAPVI
ncbi:hypothetical protein A2U01_0108716, partial [Trifolium medium]|nr:hypothetical protein [Trifolium medium]